MPAREHHPWRTGATALALVLVVVLGVACAKRSRSTPTRLSVAAAASLRDVLPDLVRAVEASHAGVQIDVVYGSSGSLYAQIGSHAPFDVFLSADETFPAQLLKDGNARPGSVAPYASGRLALWTPLASGLDLQKGMSVLSDRTVKRISIANPRLAPYGAAAMQAIDRSGVRALLSASIVEAENIAQAAQQVESGATDIGILALSTVKSVSLADKGRAWTIPAELHDPIVHAGCVVSYSPDPATAQGFLDFLRSPPAKAIFADHGFGTPP